MLTYGKIYKGRGGEKMTIAIIVLSVIVFVCSPIIVLFILFFPYALTVIKRISALKQIEKAAEQKGYKVFSLHPMSFFARNTGADFDILIENPSRAILIKLWSAVRCENSLVIKRDGSALEVSAAPDPINAQQKRKYRVHEKKRKLPRPTSKLKLRRGQTAEKILLYYPRYDMTLLDNGKTRRELSDGDKLFGMTVCSPDSIKDLL